MYEDVDEDEKEDMRLGRRRKRSICFMKSVVVVVVAVIMNMMRIMT